MKTIILMRHGQAESNSSDGSDFNRKLTKFGILETEKAAQKLKNSGYFPEVILFSEAKRTKATAEIVQTIFDKKQKLMVNQFLYLASSERILYEIQCQEDEINCLLLIGHNPGIGLLAQSFGFYNDWLDVSEVAVFKFETDSWLTIEPKQSNFIGNFN